MTTLQKLAIDGGTPVRKAPFASWPYFSQDVIDAAILPLKSGRVNYWTGIEGREFEKEFAALTRCKHAIALANGTQALELALFALDIGPGDEVITSCRTFIASASCIVMRGATPIMADVDRLSQNLTADSIAAVISPRTKAIIVIHLAGWPCDMDKVMALANQYGLKVIEDCAQSHGACYKNRPVGSIGDIGAVSFCQDKILTTGGEGGMLITNNEKLWKRAWAYKDHGKDYDSVYNKVHPPGFRWLHESFGTNMRLTEIQSAIGRAILKKLPKWVETRRHHAEILTNAFQNLPSLRVTNPKADFYHSYYKYYTFVRPEQLKAGWDRNRIMVSINAEGIPCFSGSCSEIYLEKAFTKLNLNPLQRLPVAKELGETSLMFLVHPTLDDDAMKQTTEAVQKVLSHATKH